MAVVGMWLVAAMAAAPKDGDAPFSCDREPEGDAELILHLDPQRAPDLTFPLAVRTEGVTCEVTGPGRFVLPVAPTPAGATSRAELFTSSSRDVLVKWLANPNSCHGVGCIELYFVALPDEPVVLHAVPAYGYPVLAWERSIGPGPTPLFRYSRQGPSWPKETVPLAEGRGLVTLAHMYSEIVLAPRPGKTYEIVDASNTPFATIREDESVSAATRPRRRR